MTYQLSVINYEIFGNVCGPSETSGDLREPPGTFGNLRKPPETVGNFRKPSETFGNLRGPPGSFGDPSPLHNLENAVKPVGANFINMGGLLAEGAGYGHVWPCGHIRPHMATCVAT